MIRSCLLASCVLGLGLALTVTAGGCGSGGPSTANDPTTDPGPFVADFLGMEVRIDQSLPASFGPVRQPDACCAGANVYAVWEDYRNGQSDILFNVSTDQGATWRSADVRLDAGTPPGAVRAVRPAICCDGDKLYVAWIESREPGTFGCYVNRSLDGGMSWLPQQVRVDTGGASNPHVCCAGDTVIVTWSDDRTGDDQIYVARSTDAGLTWSEQRIGGVAGFDALQPKCCCEVFGMVHYVYVAWSDTRMGGEQVYFDRSTDGGASWGTDVMLDTATSHFVSDMCCDGNYVYVAWLGLAGPRLRGSDDFGATFAARQDLKTSTGGIGYRPRICCEGARVHAVFSDTSGGQRDVYYNGSMDAGATVLADQVRIDNSMAGQDSLLPEVCCNAATITCVFSDDRSGTHDVHASRSTDIGATWSTDVRLDAAGGAVEVGNRAHCCAGTAVYALYADERDGMNRGQLHTNVSTNDGASWLATDVRVSQPDPAGTRASTTSPRIAVKGTTVHAVFEDWRLGERRIFYNRSTDGGLTWLPADVLLDAGAAGTSDGSPVICCTGSAVHVAWSRTDPLTSFDDVHAITSADGGLTWPAAATRLNTGVAANSTSTTDPAICCDGALVCVAWTDNRNGDGDVFVTRSTDGGGTWAAAATRVDHAMAGTNTWEARICCDAQRVNVIWRDHRDGQGDVYTNRSLDGGATWQPVDTRLDVGDPAGASYSSYLALCCDGPYVYAAWVDDREGGTDAYVASSSDGGASFLPEKRVDVGTLPGASDAEEPALCCAGTRVYLVWADTRSGQHDIYFNRSLDAGATWLADDVRLDLGDGAGSAQSDRPAICCRGDRVYVAWNDERATDPGPYFTASSDAGATWLPASLRVSGAPQTTHNVAQVACSDAFVYVLWTHAEDGATDAVVNRTRP